MKVPRKATIVCSLLLCIQFLLAAIAAGQKPEVNQPAFSPKSLLTARAAELAASVGQEAAKLKDPVESIQFQLEAARLLAREHPEDALRVLNLALNEVRECPASWKSKEKQDKSFQLLSLRGDILSLYTKVDRPQADKLLKALPDCSVAEKDTRKSEQPDGSANWDARHRADELVKVGVSKLDQSPAEAVSVILASVSGTGEISEEMAGAVKKLRDAGSDQAAGDIEAGLVKIVSTQTSLDAFDHEAVAALLAADPRMSPAARQVLGDYLIRGLKGFVAAIKESQVGGRPLQLDYDNLGYLYCAYLRSIRRVLEKNLPGKSEYVNTALQQIADVLPEKWLDLASQIPVRLSPEQASRELERTLEMTNAEARDSRLATFSLRALAGYFMKERGLELAAPAIEAIRNSELRAILEDYFLMAEVRAKIEEENGASAQEKARAIANPLWRAWTLMAVGYALTKQPSDAVQLFESAAQTLEKSPQTPRRAEVAFKLADLWSERDPPRAFEVLSRAIEYANQINKPDVNPQIENII